MDLGTPRESESESLFRIKLPKPERTWARGINVRALKETHRRRDGLRSRSKGHPSIHRFIHTEKRMKCLLPIKFCARLQGLQQQNNNNNNNDDDNNNKIINRTRNEMGPPGSKT